MARARRTLVPRDGRRLIARDTDALLVRLGEVDHRPDAAGLGRASQPVDGDAHVPRHAVEPLEAVHTSAGVDTMMWWPHPLGQMPALVEQTCPPALPMPPE